MGTMFQPVCESCHSTFDSLGLGVGMMYPDKEYKIRICYECQEIKEIETPNRTNRCGRCKSELLIVGEEEFEGTTLKCPKCKKPSLHFMWSGMWD